ncbi:MAG: conserved rane protein of unknown function [Patescibacteria group bacterium]|nr:conserved rane protein of unknown function [Patescibacteria group bacterium]
MASATKIRPPFVWLGRYTVPISTTLVLAIGAFFRFYQLSTLPPGLYQGTATLGLQAAGLAEHGKFIAMNATNGYAPLWVWLQALSVKFFGHTSLALHLWPALLGTLAIPATWLWARSWFGIRVAWLASLLVAITPWAVMLSRNGQSAAVIPLLVPLTLWLATLVRRRPSLWRYVALAATLTLDLLSGPIGWLLVLLVLATGAIWLLREKPLRAITKPRLVGAAGLAAGIGLFGYLAGTSADALKHLPTASGLTASLSTLGGNLGRTLLMFNVRGDENYRHNLAGEPMLNAFVGLMLVAGLLVGISRLHERRYQVAIAFTFIMLLPALLTTAGVPNAARAAGALPFVLVLAAIGISYMLELWYTTFPINSAARASGQAAVILLLALTLFQGYTQYFRAWAGSSEVYAAYNEGSAQIAANLQTDKFKGERYLVASKDEQPVVAFLNPGKIPYQAIQAQDIAGLPIPAVNRQFMITSTSRDESVKILKIKFPGGVLRPHYSSFNQAEIYYTYEVAK